MAFSVDGWGSQPNIPVWGLPVRTPWLQSPSTPLTPPLGEIIRVSEWVTPPTQPVQVRAFPAALSQRPSTLIEGTAGFTNDMRWWKQPNEPVRVPANLHPNFPISAQDPRALTQPETTTVSRWWKQPNEPVFTKTLPVAAMPFSISNDPASMTHPEATTVDRWFRLPEQPVQFRAMPVSEMPFWSAVPFAVPHAFLPLAFTVTVTIPEFFVDCASLLPVGETFVGSFYVETQAVTGFAPLILSNIGPAISPTTTLLQGLAGQAFAPSGTANTSPNTSATVVVAFTQNYRFSITLIAPPTKTLTLRLN